MSQVARDLAANLHAATDEAETYKQPEGINMQRLCANRLPRVAIIGAGVSGLRCADLLTRTGSGVAIFEARDRLGGRVHQVDNGGYLVDTGSNWIHGTDGNPIMTLAEETQTVLMSPEERMRIIDRQGHRKSEAESQELSAGFWEMILEGFKHSDQHSKTIDPKESLADWLHQQWSKKFKDDPKKVEDLEATSKLWGQFVGSPIERQSLKFFFLEEGLDGENLFVAGTYKKILEAIMKPALDKAELHLNAEIKHIQYRSVSSEEPVKIRTSTGTQHTFDEVVVTCPLGWLKINHSTAFSPALPPRLTQAINSIGYGALEKLYVSFPTAFWLDGPQHNDTTTWPYITDFHSPAYHPDPTSSTSPSWNQSVLSLAHLPSPSAHPTLLFYMTGDSGTYLTTHLKCHNLKPHSEPYNKFLKSFAEPFYSRLPNYDATSEICTPTSFYMTSWANDPFAGFGSYSTFRTGLTEGDRDIEVMRDAGGLGGEGRGLWLAGEHTAPFVALGTTTGAWWSGEGVARGIARRYGLDVGDRFSSGEGVKAAEEKGKDNTVPRQMSDGAAT